MRKLWKFFEYAYLIIAIIFTIETILNWTANREKAYLFMFFAVLAVFMYFFRKRFRKKMSSKNNQ